MRHCVKFIGLVTVMRAMNYLLADAIDFPLVLGLGLAVTGPLLLFEAGVESFVLAQLWKLRIRELFRLMLRANLFSLMAGIPTKVVNAVIYGLFLPQEFPRFAVRYPYLVAVGTLIYFLVTLVVEGMCAAKWMRRASIRLPSRRIWTGIFLANVATYAVVAPLHCYLTQPLTDVQEYTPHARWARQPETRIVFLDSTTGHLKTKLLREEPALTVVPDAMTEYLVSTNLNLCLFRSTNDALCLWRQNFPVSLITTSAGFGTIEGAAFSPNGNRVAYLLKDRTAVEVFDVPSKQRQTRRFDPALSESSRVAWTTAEESFVVTSDAGRKRWLGKVSGSRLDFEATNPTNQLDLLPCYTRTGHGQFVGGEWGSVLNFDECNGLRAWAHPGAGSARIAFKVSEGSERALRVAANPGIFHLPFINFSEVAYLDDCSECLLVGSRRIYLADLERRRLGTVGPGFYLVALTPRFLRTLEPAK